MSARSNQAAGSIDTSKWRPDFNRPECSSNVIDPITNPVCAQTGTTAGLSPVESEGVYSRFESPAVQDGIFRIRVSHLRPSCPKKSVPLDVTLIEANPDQAHLQFQFRPLDRVRYYRQQFTCSGGVGMDQVVKQLADRSRQLSHAAGRTCVVDWVINGTMNITQGQMALCDESELLHKLRNIVQSGHHGAWPRRVLYSEATTVAVCDQESPVIAEYLRMLNAAGFEPAHR